MPSLVDVLHQAGYERSSEPGSARSRHCGDRELASLAAVTLREWTPDFAFVYLALSCIISRHNLPWGHATSRDPHLVD